MIGPECSRCGEQCEPGRLVTVNNRTQLVWWCYDCERREGGQCIPHRKIANLGDVPEVVNNHDPAATGGVCEACYREAAELQLHHWAPRHLFGDERADYWPTAMLCLPCHQRWHDLVTPIQSRPSAMQEIIRALPADSATRRMLEKSEALSRAAKGELLSPVTIARWRERRAVHERRRREVS